MITVECGVCVTCCWEIASLRLVDVAIGLTLGVGLAWDPADGLAECVCGGKDPLGGPRIQE